VNKWFKKQYRTDADARLDEIEPGHIDPPPLDHDVDNQGRRVTVAPPTRREQQSGGVRPLKGGYWFIRDRYRQEAEEAVARDKERVNKGRQDKKGEEEGEERYLEYVGRGNGSHGPTQQMRSTPPRPRPRPRPSPPPPPPLSPPPQGFPSPRRTHSSMFIARPEQYRGPLPRDTGSRHYMRYPPRS